MNYTAVIIGAMLISPLMGPIMGIGLGFGIHDMPPDKTLCQESYCSNLLSFRH